LMPCFTLRPTSPASHKSRSVIFLLQSNLPLSIHCCRAVRLTVSKSRANLRSHASPDKALTIAEIETGLAPQLDDTVGTHLTLEKPTFGSRLANGVCPPSNPGRMVPPLRDFCPFMPRLEVFPIPLPYPRPTRFRCFIAPGLSRKSLS
jgi:hypothetical protein